MRYYSHSVQLSGCLADGQWGSTESATDFEAKLVHVSLRSYSRLRGHEHWDYHVYRQNNCTNCGLRFNLIVWHSTLSLWSY